MKKDRTENIQKTYKKCAPYGNCTEIVQKIYKKCAKFCNSSLVETVSLFELLQILAHFLYIFCTISVQFPYGAHFLYVFCMFSYVFCMFSVRSFFIGLNTIYCLAVVIGRLRLNFSIHDSSFFVDCCTTTLLNWVILLFFLDVF